MAETHPTAEVLRTLEEGIAPYVGPRMAKISTELQCRKLGLESETLSAEQIRALIDRLDIAMRMLVGRERTTEVVSQLERELGLGSTAS